VRVLDGRIHVFVLKRLHRMISSMDPNQTSYSNRHRLEREDLQLRRIFDLDTTVF
jgi:hypothetical protein